MLDQHRALIYTMVIVSGAQAELREAELSLIGDIVEDLPVFRDFERERLAPLLDDCAELINGEDGLDPATLIDIFRAEEDACLLGTDAVRDGVDVPGRSLRLLVFDRVPWPRPDILQRARRSAFDGAQFPDRVARLRLRQAYGRLIRRADDRGVFAILDRALPSRLLAAFPPGVPITRLPLGEAAAATARFLRTESS